MVVLPPPPNMFSQPYPSFHGCVTSTPKHVFPALSIISWLCYLHPQTCFPCPIHHFMVVLPPPPNMFSQPYPPFHGCITSTPKHVFPALSILSWLCYLHPQTCFPCPIHPFMVVLPPPPNMFSQPYPPFHSCITSTPKHVFPALSTISWLCYLHPQTCFPSPIHPFIVVLPPPPNMFSLPCPSFHGCVTSTPKHVFPALSILSWLCYLHPQTCFPCPIHPFIVVLPPPPNMFSLPCPSFHGCVTSTPKHVFPALSTLS